QAVLDYVIPYVNEREAFGEPISHRQAVAFMVANIAIELDGVFMLAEVVFARDRTEDLRGDLMRLVGAGPQLPGEF
ncbi:acyl-CoA dehydrogenase family protein, partial [Nocardia cyriacigeorgica]|uniref:acyl-CoA dehydrogenase family protein n=1 Tax=Nocardia cyriacigeorgica TaxID=135487 RepID=UPI00211521C8